jgi:hypothetical protein
MDLASEGVRKTAKSLNGDLDTRFIYDHGITFGYIKYLGVMGPIIVLNW